MTRLVATGTALVATRTTIAIKSLPPSRTFVDRLLCVILARSVWFVYAILARTLLGKHLGTPALRLSLRNVVPPGTTIVTPVKLARASVVTAVELAWTARIRAVIATRTAVVAPVELARAAIIATRATIVTTRTAVVTPVELARATVAAAVELARTAIITTRTTPVTPAIITAVELSRATRIRAIVATRTTTVAPAVIASTESATTATTSTRKSVALRAAIVVVFGLWHGSPTLRLTIRTTVNSRRVPPSAACEKPNEIGLKTRKAPAFRQGPIV